MCANESPAARLKADGRAAWRAHVRAAAERVSPISKAQYRDICGVMHVKDLVTGNWRPV